MEEPSTAGAFGMYQKPGSGHGLGWQQPPQDGLRRSRAGSEVNSLSPRRLNREVFTLCFLSHILFYSSLVVSSSMQRTALIYDRDFHSKDCASLECLSFILPSSYTCNFPFNLTSFNGTLHVNDVICEYLQRSCHFYFLIQFK